MPKSVKRDLCEIRSEEEKVRQNRAFPLSLWPDRKLLSSWIRPLSTGNLHLDTSLPFLIFHLLAYDPFSSFFTSFILIRIFFLIFFRMSFPILCMCSYLFIYSVPICNFSANHVLFHSDLSTFPSLLAPQVL